MPISNIKPIPCSMHIASAKLEVPPPHSKPIFPGDQRLSLEAYWKIFGGATNYSVIAANTIDVLTQRLGFHR